MFHRSQLIAYLLRGEAFGIFGSLFNGFFEMFPYSCGSTRPFSHGKVRLYPWEVCVLCVTSIGFLFQRNRSQDSSTPYTPYPFYSTLPGNRSITLQFTPQAAPRSFSQLHGCPEPSTSQIPQPELSEKGEKTRHTSWETIEVRSLIAAYRANYDRLKSTNSSHGKKTVSDSIMDDFLSLCSDAGRESEKTLVQIKEKWHSLFDKFKAGRDRKTFEFYDDIDKFLSGSDKVEF